jgi:hypothetical protein
MALEDSQKSLSRILKHLHPSKGREGPQQRSIDGIRIRSNNNAAVELHAVGLRLDRLCDCTSELFRTSSDRSAHPSSGCACFSLEDTERTRCLYLSKNNLTTEGLASLGRFSQVRTLSIADNMLKSVPEELRELTHLKRLSFSGNPVCGVREPHLKEKILAFVPTLTELDGRKISSLEMRRSRSIYKEECILRNLVHVIGLIQQEEPSNWGSRFAEIRGIVVGDTLEDFACSMMHLEDEYFVFSDDSRGLSANEDRLGSLSFNHALAVTANAIWVDSLAFKNSDSIQDEAAEAFLLEVTSSLVAIETILREKNEGCSLSHVEALSRSIWSALFVYISGLEQSKVSFESNIGISGNGTVQKAPSEDFMRKIQLQQEEIRALRSQRDELVEQVVNIGCREREALEALNAAQCDRQALQVKADDMRSEKDQMKAVLHLLSEEVELAKQSKETLERRNKALVDELDDLARDRAALAGLLREQETCLVEERRAAAEKLADQKASFEDCIQILSLELNTLRQQPRVPITIEVINPDITLELERDQAVILQLQSDLKMLRHRQDVYLAEEQLAEVAGAFRCKMTRSRTYIASAEIFRGWLRLTRDNVALKQFECRLQMVADKISSSRAARLLRAWCFLSRKSKLAVQLRYRCQKSVSTSVARIALRRWSDLVERGAQVKRFLQNRDFARTQRAFNELQEHCKSQKSFRSESEQIIRCHWQQSFHRSLFGLWRSLTHESRSRTMALEARLMGRLDQLRAKNAFEYWLESFRYGKRLALAEKTARQNLQTRVFRALAALTLHASRVIELQKSLSSRRRRGYLIICFSLWINETVLQRKLREKEHDAKRGVLREALGAWRTYSWLAAKASTTDMVSRLQRDEKKIAMTLSFSSWRLCTLEGLLEASQMAVENQRKKSLTMASSMDKMQEHMVHERNQYRKTLSSLRMKHDNLGKRHRSLNRLLAQSLSDASRLHQTQEDFAALADRRMRECNSMKENIIRLESENKNLKLRLRASEAVKDAVRLRQANQQVVRSWSLSAHQGP